MSYPQPQPDPPTHTTILNIPYTVTFPHPRQVLDLHIPIPSSNTPSSPSSSPFPLILYIHGGAFRHGSKESPLLPLRQVIVNTYTVAALNYRRSGEALFPAMIQDCKSAIRFLRSPTIAQKYNIDPTRVVVWGESAGGHAAAFLGTTSKFHGDTGEFDVGDFLDVPGSSSVVGVVDYYGPTDFLKMDQHLPEGWRTHGDRDSPESMYLGKTIGEVPGLVRRADPCAYVEGLVREAREREGTGTEGGSWKGALPEFFIAHGTQDRIVPEYMSILLRDELVKYGVGVEYFAVEGADHVFKGILDGQQRELDERTDEFLKRVFGR